MSDESELAAKVSGETPWWAHAKDVPVWLAAGIVGVPSLIALLAGWFIAQNVTHNQKIIMQYDLSEMTMLNEIDHQLDSRWSVIAKFMGDNLRVQYISCVNAAHTDVERSRCITVEQRQQRYGLKPNEVPDPP